MFSYIVTKAIQVLHLHRHIIHLCMQNTQVYDTESSSVLGGCWHSNKETKYFEHSREMADWKWHYLLCGGALILEESYTQKKHVQEPSNTWQTVHYTAGLLSTFHKCSVGKHPNQLPFLLVPLPQMSPEDRKTSLSILPTTMLLNYDYTLGQSSQATECIVEDGFQLKLQGLVF